MVAVIRVDLEDGKMRKNIIKNLKRIDKLMELRIRQLKEAYQYQWYETSLKDDNYKYLCWNYTRLKLMLNPVVEISFIAQAKQEKELRELMKGGMLEIEDIKKKLIGLVDK